MIKYQKEVVAMIFLPFWYCFVLCYDFNTFWAFLVVIKGLSRNIDLRKYNILTKSFAIEFVLQLYNLLDATFNGMRNGISNLDEAVVKIFSTL